MTVFLGATPHPATDSSTHFRLSAAANPSALARIVGLFAKLELMPDAFATERAADGMVDVEVRFGRISADQAEHVARALRQMIEVEQVLVAYDQPARDRALA
ncbi:MAG: hypothetical protein VW338_15145 [Rhodospirillaceae bacterium]|jgi:hypothetical protein